MTDIDQKDGQGKACSKCGEWKPFEDYHTAKKEGGGRRFVAACKECANANNRQNARKKSKEAVERVRQWRKDPANLARKNELERARRKDPTIAEKNKKYNNEWRNRPKVRENMNASRRKRRNSDPELRAKENELKREYYARPEIFEREKAKRRELYSTREWKDNFNTRRRERYLTDPDFLCAIKCRGMVIRTARKARQKKNGKTVDALGYSAHQLRLRMECQFKPGMSWAIHGEWHIDHKKPIAAFLAQGITDPKIINSLCNLQPMWGEENQTKGAKWKPANDNTNYHEVESA